MSQTLEIHIQLGAETHRVGTLFSHVRGGSESSTFNYHEDWLTNSARFAIQPDMKLGRSGHHVSSENGSLPGAVRDGSPDRWGRKLIMRQAKREQEPSPVSEIGYLLALDDYSRIGALRYREEGCRSFLRQPGEGRTVPPLIELPRLLNAAEAVGNEAESTEDLRFLLGVGSPLGGARPKSAVIDRDGVLAIAKFPKADDDRNIAAGEVLLAELARLAGINSCESRLVRIEEQPVSVIRRFDRNGNGERLHFISAMTMLGGREGQEGAYTDIALAIRRYSAEPSKDAHELFRRAAFNVLATNLDDHLRNHGFFYDMGSRNWRLSPAYDLNPVPITERPRVLETWLSEAGPEATLSNLLPAAREFALQPHQAREIVRDVAEVTCRWRDVGRKLGLSESELAPYETAFEHDELREAQKVVIAPPNPRPSIGPSL